VEANKSQLDVLKRVLNIEQKDYSGEESIKSYMKDHKTDCALKIFNSKEEIHFPPYILDAIRWAKK
jgi:putative ATP-dependent endonuclease of OLD family